MRRGCITNKDGTTEGSRVSILADDFEWIRKTFAPGIPSPAFGMMVHRMVEVLDTVLTDEMHEELKMKWAIDDANYTHFLSEKRRRTHNTEEDGEQQ